VNEDIFVLRRQTENTDVEYCSPGMGPWVLQGGRGPVDTVLPAAAPRQPTVVILYQNRAWGDEVEQVAGRRLEGGVSGHHADFSTGQLKAELCGLQALQRRRTPVCPGRTGFSREDAGLRREDMVAQRQIRPLVGRITNQQDFDPIQTMLERGQNTVGQLLLGTLRLPVDQINQRRHDRSRRF